MVVKTRICSRTRDYLFQPSWCLDVAMWLRTSQSDVSVIDVDNLWATALNEKPSILLPSSCYLQCGCGGYLFRARGKAWVRRWKEISCLISQSCHCPLPANGCMVNSEIMTFLIEATIVLGWWYRGPDDIWTNVRGLPWLLCLLESVRRNFAGQRTNTGFGTSGEGTYCLFCAHFYKFRRKK